MNKETGAQSGKVRAAAVDKKTQARISKALQQKLARSNAAVNASNVLSGTHSVWAGGRSTVGRDNANGMASSVAFTPLKGNDSKFMRQQFLVNFSFWSRILD